MHGVTYEEMREECNRRALAAAKAHVEASSGVHFSYAGRVLTRGSPGSVAYDRVSIEAIYGVIDHYSSREAGELDGRRCLLRFEITHKSHEQAMSLIRSKGKRATPVESDDSDSSDDSASLSAVQPMIALRKGRNVADHRGTAAYKA